MANITPGIYTVEEVLALAEFDISTEAAVDYNDRGWDPRRVNVGGLTFDELGDTIRVPETATDVEINLDNVTVATLTVVPAE